MPIYEKINRKRKFEFHIAVKMLIHHAFKQDYIDMLHFAFYFLFLNGSYDLVHLFSDTYLKPYWCSIMPSKESQVISSWMVAADLEILKLQMQLIANRNVNVLLCKCLIFWP